MKLKHKIKKETGQAMVEFALVLPILLLFIGGIIDFGWIFHNQILVNNAVREETRELAIYYHTASGIKIHGPTFDDVEGVVASSIQSRAPNIDAASADTTITVGDVGDDEDDKKYGEQITVVFTGHLKILTPILSTVLGENYNVESSSTMRIEKN